VRWDCINIAVWTKDLIIGVVIILLEKEREKLIVVVCLLVKSFHFVEVVWV